MDKSTERRPCLSLVFLPLSRWWSCAAVAVRLLFLSTLLVTLCISPSLAGEVKEAELSAAYIYQISRFTKWPPSAFRHDRAPLIICVYGKEAWLMPELTRATENKRVSGHRIVVERRVRGEPLETCHIAAIGESERPFLAPLLRGLMQRPLLTVSEIPGFAAAGGMVGFTWQGRRLRFEINLESARSAELNISSRLLRLATRVIR